MKMKISRYSILEAVHKCYPRAKVAGITEIRGSDGLWRVFDTNFPFETITKWIKSFANTGCLSVNLVVVDQYGGYHHVDFSIKEFVRG